MRDNFTFLIFILLLSSSAASGAVIPQPQAVAHISRITAKDLEETGDETTIRINDERVRGGPYGEEDDNGTYWLFENMDQSYSLQMHLFEGNAGEVKINLFEQDGVLDANEDLGTVTIAFANGAYESIKMPDGVNLIGDNPYMDSGENWRTLTLEFDKDPNAKYEVEVSVLEGKLGANVCICLEWWEDVRKITDDEDLPPPTDNVDEVLLYRFRQIIEPRNVSPIERHPNVPHEDLYEISVGTIAWKSKGSGHPLLQPELGGGVLFVERSIILTIEIIEKDGDRYDVPDIDPVTGMQRTDSQGNPKFKSVPNADDTVARFAVELSLKENGGTFHVFHEWFPRDSIEIGGATLSSSAPYRADETQTAQMRARGQGCDYWLRGVLKVLEGDRPCIGD